MPALTAYVNGIGLLGPGLSDWPSSLPVLAGGAPYVPQPTLLPVPAALPAAERRRTGTIVKLALAVGFEATSTAEMDPATLTTVFSSSGGDGRNCHEICEVLASSDRQVSPTRFHNSVHNASAGYWSIATGATPASNAICAFDASFAAGLLEALALIAVERKSVLLIAYDASYPEPLRSKRPILDSFAVALVLAPVEHGRSLARLSAAVIEAKTDSPDAFMPESKLEALRSAIPAARSLPLLRRLARREPGPALLDYLDAQWVAVEVSF
jgi:hypothetical protein